ncbi:MAG: PEP-utilizing enzyme [Firmicutes bacterium]|nr:PEP-utilizing enzyme [Bacillota bacterium]
MQIIRLDELKQIDYFLAGGKAKGLAELIKAGLRVANGFVIIGLKTEEDYLKAAEYYENLPYKLVAVRSSATNEDGCEFSNAGQYLSSLNVSGKTEFINALKACMNSLHSNTAESYSAFFSLGAKQAQMSIVVQEMVDARAAGVCFSFDPVTRRNNYIIEAVEGLGESLVAGTASAERHVVPEPGTAENVFPFVGKNGIISIDEINKIANQMKTAVKHFGYQLDMEYAISKAGKLIWLQARPITTLSEATIDELDSPALPTDVITSCNIGEMLPGVVTPLSISTTVRAIDYGLRDMLVKAHTYKSLEKIPPTSCIANFSGQLFFNFTPLYRLSAFLIGTSAETLEYAICGESLNVPIPSFKNKPQLVRCFNMISYLRFVLGGKKAIKKADKQARRFKIPVSGNLAADYKAITDGIQELNNALTYHYQTSSYSGAMSSTLNQIIKADKSEEEANAIVAGLLVAIDDIESVDILRSLRVLAAAILEAEPNANNMTWEELNNFITKSEYKVEEAYDFFISRHGHRAIREAELRSRSWQNDPKALMEYIKTVMGSGNVAEPEQKNSFEKNLKTFLAGYKGLKRAALKYLVKQSRLGVKLREHTKSKFIKVTEEFKIAYDKLAENLVNAGALPEKDLIFFLTHDEIGELINNKKASLVKRAMQRKRIFAEQQTIKFAKVNVGKPKPIEQKQYASKSGMALNGTPISRGNVSGKARVVKSVDDAKELQKGEIMVASFTDIGWSPYYCLVGGLVTEIGSALSHGAVVAREYALPLVVNVANATHIIKTGDEIALNAVTGTVTILASAK